jgi:serine protease Do
MIRTVVAQLEENGHVTRGYIGVEAQQLKGATAEALHLSENSGALIAGVQPDSPASNAGIEPGDVIQSVNGTKIKNPRDLAVNIAGIKPGDEAKLQVLRDGQTKDIDLKVAQMPSEQVASNQTGGQEHKERLGLALAPLSPGVRGQLDLPSGTKGAVISGVQPGSPAQMAGLQPGDVIVGVGTKSVDSPSEAVNAIRSAMNGKNHAVALRVIRDGQPIFVGINMEQQQNQG